MFTPALALVACLFPLLTCPVPVRAEPAGGWTLPLDPPLVVVHGFDPPPARWLAGHRGVDLATAVGATVRATGPGLVTYSGVVAGRGVVVISHGGRYGDFRTTYEPVTASVLPGQQVVAGDAVGVVAATPGHCSPAVCLHWGLRQGDVYRDPRQLLEPTAVRLLPLGGVPLPVSPYVSAARSGPWVGLFVGAAQPFDRYMGVDLRSRQ
jgi:murein DD-endopeptidase MepM/ murein hydrolase activator NlpD